MNSAFFPHIYTLIKIILTVWGSTPQSPLLCNMLVSSSQTSCQPLFTEGTQTLTYLLKENITADNEQSHI